MDVFNAVFNSLLLLFFAAFSWAPPVVGLTVIAALVGVGMLWVFRRTSDQTRMKAVKRKVYASLLELRVFADEPAVTWRAQKSLFAANFRYMGLALRPALAMSVPLAVLLIHLEAFYGRAPLPVGRETTVTMAMRAPFDSQKPTPQLEAFDGVAVEIPPVRAIDERQVSWRIRPAIGGSSHLLFTVDGKAVRKTIESGSVQRFIPGRSVSSSIAAVWNPNEKLIPSPKVEWIEVRYPEAWIDVFGVRLNWIVWFLAVSMVSALLLKKRFGVVL
ncbi:MAG TPA: hypothetical protein VKJ01_20200 [Candidatus Solibacter sp.]|jgi:hypothetical protein|nr:hypothetical protein [Candidatus Solibacter sp.]